MRLHFLFPFLLTTIPGNALAQSLHQRLLDAGSSSELPLVIANDNRTAAGRVHDGILELDLDVGWADWRIEGVDGPGLRVVTLTESGKEPTIPGPLLRVETGTRVRARVHNSLTNSNITVFGLHTRPALAPDSLVIGPGEQGEVEFEPGEPGTYLYWVQLGKGLEPFTGEREQLAGAFIVDPTGGSPPDRIFVMNIFSTAIDTTLHEYGALEALTINGMSWPFTERQRPAVGKSERWRVINASYRSHPMHLHGFFYDVISTGTALSDVIYKPEDRRTVVTETMRGHSTMVMEWTPRRPGNWLFHCHLSFHVAPDIRLPGALEPEDQEIHMAGLVLGIEVQPGPSDLISKGEPREITLHVNEYADDSLYTYGFSLDPDFRPDSLHGAAPGPPLFMNQYQTTYVTVKNHMSIPTGIHWHGLEIDGWSDGVPGWSASDGRVSPVIQPGEEFTYKLSLMRPGTFIYHSHLNDVNQLSGGLYAPLIVVGEGDSFDPTTDHLAIVGWKTPNPKSIMDRELNGRFEQPDQHAVVGETHRIRLMHIAPAGQITIRMLKADSPVSLRAVAKDGAEFPPHQKVDVEVSRRMGVGATADFEFTPAEAGIYDLVIGYRRRGWHQKWIVKESEGLE